MTAQPRAPKGISKAEIDDQRRNLRGYGLRLIVRGSGDDRRAFFYAEGSQLLLRVWIPVSGRVADCDRRDFFEGILHLIQTERNEHAQTPSP